MAVRPPNILNIHSILDYPKPAADNSGATKQNGVSIVSLSVNQYTQELTGGEVYRNVLREYPDVLNVPQVSAALGVSTKTVYRLLRLGNLRSLKVGREFRIPKLYVMQYIQVLDYADN